jgi:hypothetical protein
MIKMIVVYFSIFSPYKLNLNLNLKIVDERLTQFIKAYFSFSFSWF